jgi:hypothetical protein
MKIPEALWKKIADDPRTFFRFLQVFDKQQAKLVPFVLNSEQEELLDALLTHNRIVVCKARQIGCSTLIRAYFLWRSYIEKEPTRHAIISYTRDSADHLHSIDKQFYTSLPLPLQRTLSKSSSRTLGFKDTGAELRSFTGGGKGGATRSFTFSSAHISEFAFFDDQDELLANTIASVGEGQIIIETTTNGPGDKYHQLCMGSPLNGWHLCFFPWYQHKNYKKRSAFGQNGVPPMTEEEKQMMEDLGLQKQQMYWRRTQITTMGIEKFKREFPSSVDEAFMSDAKIFYPSDVLDACEIVELGGTDRWYCDPHQGDSFAMGVDVALGKGGDYSTITVISTTTLQPIYHFRSNTILPQSFADKIWEVYWEFNEPVCLIESNGPGALVIYRCKEFGMRKLWRDKNGNDWTTRKENKLAIYDNVRELLCEGQLACLDSTLWNEMRNCVILDNGQPGHPKGTNDDLLFSFALAQWVAKENPAPSLYEVRKGLMEEFMSKTRARRIRARGPLPFWRKGQ